MKTGERTKIAIIGGGCAAVAAAFELTRPQLGSRFEVTIYQLGWRLGGKGASGRGPCDRIEEHGLHLWMGFYENAFRLMRDCYEELGRDPAKCRIADWRDAFSPCPLSAVADLGPDGKWLQWKVLFPSSSGDPGDPLTEESRWTLGRYLARCFALIGTLLESLQSSQAAPLASLPVQPSEPRSPSELLDRVSRLLSFGHLGTLAALREAMRLLEVATRWLPELPQGPFLSLHGLLKNALELELGRLTRDDQGLRRLWEILDLMLAVVRGFLWHRLLWDPRGLDAINDYDCREWLRMHGASEGSLNSAFVRGLYDLAFAYADGDFNRPSIAAGQAVRGAFRAFFTYRGAFFWKMHAGMGDIVFAPLYEVLQRRGVRFEFFHRLVDIKLGESRDGERRFVQGLEFEVQAKPRQKSGYAPLVDVRGLPCWPSAPLYEQLTDGQRLRASGHDFESFEPSPSGKRKLLEVAKDFDLVLLGVGGGALEHVSRQLIERDPAWRAMVRHTTTVATQALQLWLSSDFAELGWGDGPVNLSGFVQPFDTWADMTHLATEEGWPVAPRAIAYFCSVFPDAPRGTEPSTAERAEEVLENARIFLDRDVSWLWPGAKKSASEFRWDLLVAPGDASPTGATRLRTQFWRANVHPSDRYTLALPGTLQFRISPLDQSYDNFSVCGDWTDCGFNEGCVESAVMSGRLAAHALCGAPALDDIVGYDHP
jgi:uncharacterized protein with NAD-binding domain and iron-sulfur cluster